MKLVSIIPDDVPSFDGAMRDVSGRLIGAPSGDLPPTEIVMDFPVGKFIAIPGIPGPPGPPGQNTQITGESLTGVRDGVNAYFTTQNLYKPNSTCVYRNGLREQRGFSYYEPEPGVIEFDEAPTSYDHVTIDYLIA